MLADLLQVKLHEEFDKARWKVINMRYYSV